MCPPFIKSFFDKTVANLVLLALVLTALFGVGLGDRPYSAPSESRYIEIGREMAESGDFVTPRLDYVKYFEKPPLFYWVQAISTKLFGFDPYAARVPTMLFAVALCLLTYALGNMLYGRLAGWLSALVLATSIYLFVLSRVVLVDVPVSVFLVATLAGFLYCTRAPEGCRRTFVLYMMYVAAACAVLTKGLIGAVLPGIIIFLWLALTDNWRLLKTLRLPSGIMLFLLICVPWHVLVSLRNPEFPHFYFIHEHFERYLTKVHGRYQPFWFFGAVLLAGLFPWISFAFQAVKTGLNGFWQKRKSEGTELFLVIWIAFIFVFFSLSDSKLIPYILPIFPPIAVLIGSYLAKGWREEPVPFFGTGTGFMILFFLAVALLPQFINMVVDADSKVMVAIKQAKDDIQVLSAIAIIAAGVLAITFIQGKRKHVIMAMLIASVLLVQAGDGIASHYNKDSMEKFAAMIKDLHKPGDEIALYGEYYQDLPIYLQRRVTLVGWEQTELQFGATHENTSAWMIGIDEFWKRWKKNDHRMFAVMRREMYDQMTKNKTPETLHLYPLVVEGRNILLMNQMPDEKKP